MKMGLHSLSWKGIGIDVQSQPAEFVSLQDKNMGKQYLSVFSFELDQKKGIFLLCQDVPGSCSSHW